MKDIKILMRQKDELVTRMETIVNAAVAEERGYTDEERAEVSSLRTKIKDFDEIIRDAREAREAASGAGDRKPEGDAGEPDSTGEVRYRNAGEFLRDLYGAYRGHPSEKFRRASQVITEQVRAMNISEAASLGMLMPEQMVETPLRLEGQGGFIRQRATVIPPGERPDARYRRRVYRQGQDGVYNGIVVNYAIEGKAKSTDKSAPKYDWFVLDPLDKKVAYLYETTEDALENFTAVTADVENLIRGARSHWEEDRFLRGTGVGEPMGILNESGRLEVARDTSAQFKFADVVAMRKVLYPRASNPAWELSLDLYDQVASMVDGSNRLIMIAGDATRGMPDLLHGRPIHWSEFTPTSGNPGDAILVDWSYYVIKDGAGPFFRTDEGKGSGFEDGIVKFKATYKVDAGLWVREPLKLDNGMKVSPVVVLK